MESLEGTLNYRVIHSNVSDLIRSVLYTSYGRANVNADFEVWQRALMPPKFAAIMERVLLHSYTRNEEKPNDCYERNSLAINCRKIPSFERVNLKGLKISSLFPGDEL